MPHSTKVPAEGYSLPDWARLLLIVLTVGGGVSGLTMTLAAVTGPDIKGGLNTLIALLFAALYGYVVIAGLVLVVNPARTLPVILAFVPQLAFFSSTALTYRFVSGPWLIFSYSNLQYYFGFRLGGEWSFYLDRPVPVEVGINVMAIVALTFLIAHRFSNSNPDANFSD